MSGAPATDPPDAVLRAVAITAAAPGGAYRPLIEAVDLGAVAGARGLAGARRAVQVGAAMARHLAPVLVRTAGRSRATRARLLGRALEGMAVDLGATFVKFAQLLASSPSLAGEALADAMRGVLDDGPGVPWDQVRAVVEEDLGAGLDEVFVAFEPEPFAAASIAVVHRATLRDGTDVAVKIQRPGTAQTVAVDFALLRPLVGWLARQAPVGTLPGLVSAVEALSEQLAEELDFRNEARVMEWFSTMTALIGASRVFAPRPVAGACGRRVLTMEYIPGSTIDDLEAIGSYDIDARAAIETLIESWFSLTLCTGIFHGDMHAGNLLLTPDGRVALLDWGIVGRLPEPSRRFFRRSIEGALGDETAWADVRDHMLSSVDIEGLRAVGVGEGELLSLVRAQTMAIMNSPFSELDLAMLLPGADGPGSVQIATPTTLRGWIRLIRQERRRLREAKAEPPAGPPRGDLLLIKQLVFFERYGKQFLGDRALIYDTDVYRALLARPDLVPVPAAGPEPYGG